MDLESAIAQQVGDRDAEEIRELVLDACKATKVSGLEKFVNLEVLWLNDNQLRKIDSLDSNVRIKKLNVMNNSIETLEDSSLLKFKFLGEFIVANNNCSTFWT